MGADEKRLLMLTTTISVDRTQVQIQSRAKALLSAKGIPYETLDGAEPENKEARNELFKLSGIRGAYPQFFMIHGEDRIEFLGDWDKIEAMNDASSLPDDVLQSNPNIMTWERIFA